MTEPTFQSSETFEEDDELPAVNEPSEEEQIEQEFDSGLSQVLGIEQEEDSKPESAATLIAGMTEDELKDVLNKARQVDEINDRLRQTHDKAFGKIGQLEQSLKDLRASRQSSQPITKEAFKTLSAYLEDEEMAEALAQDISTLQLSGAPAINFDMDAINEQFNSQLQSRTDELSRQFEMKLLSIAHKDWRQISESEEFETWKSTLPESDQTVLSETWDGSILADAMTQFKTWRGKRNEAADRKKRLLEDNVQISGGSSGRARTAADDSFEQGFKRVISSR